MLADLTQSRAAGLYAALTEVERLAALLPLAPDLSDRMKVSDLLAERHARYRALLDGLGGASDPKTGMAAAAPAVDDARRRVAADDWWEGLVTVALCVPLTDELFKALVAENGVAGEGASDVDPWPVQQLRAATEADEQLRARIALWARRVVGEAIVLAREFGGDRYLELADLLAANHAKRLAAFGLDD
ncbi:MAG: ferritin-like fold-containing protein [Actinocrinis sp.]